jgi:hypothetical protein
MMKKFIALGPFSKGGKSEGDLGGKGVTPVFGEAKIMTTFS